LKDGFRFDWHAEFHVTLTIALSQKDLSLAVDANSKSRIFWRAISVAMKESMDLRRCGSRDAAGAEFRAKDAVAYATTTAASRKIRAMRTEATTDHAKMHSAATRFAPRSASTGSACEVTHAGAIPKITPVRTEMPSVREQDPLIEA
jgi:hypothetical protein